MGKNVYEECPVLETESFTLRLVSLDDAEDLLVCYQDPEAGAIFNSDYCNNDFRFDTMEEMKEEIRFWLDEYKAGSFVRFAVIDKETNKAVGTAEMFHAEGPLDEIEGWGVLRIDMASKYEDLDYIEQLLELADKNFFEMFDVDMIVTKAIPEATDRVLALMSVGYAPFEWEEEREHYFSRTAD